MKLYLGCSGWQYSEWKGSFYDSDLAKARWFDYYAQHFNSVEINYSYYHFPSEKSILRWKENAPPGFKYSLKVNKAIIYKRMHDTERLLKDFYDLTELLEDKLGCLVFQWPASVKYDEGLLERLFEQLESTKTNVIEFRDQSWWREDVFNKFKATKNIFCSVSAPKLPAELIDCHKKAYIRFHGVSKWFYGSYTEQQLILWVEQLKKYGIKELWVYFNNTANAAAPTNALLLNNLIKNNFLTRD